MELAGKSRRYRVLDTLGEGGTGTVLRAFDRIEGREVAIKVLEARVDPGSDSLARDEFRLLASHSHENLVEVYDFGAIDDGRRYFTMEILEGEDLLAFCRGCLCDEELGTSSEVRDIFLQILRALDFVHTRGLVHRDLKPKNFIVRRRDDATQVKLIDFGLAGDSTTPGARFGGTVEYLSPERLEGKAADPRSDLYSLGVIWYEVLLGRPPFTADSPAEVARAHLEDEVPDAVALPHTYRDIVLRLLAKSPDDRPGTAEEVLRCLVEEPSKEVRSPPGLASVFVGRDPVLDRLLREAPGREHSARAAHREASSHSTGRGVEPAARAAGAFLVGPTGVGKSRLLRELRIRAQLSGRTLACEYGREGGEAPGALLRRLLEKLAAEVSENPDALGRLDDCLDELRDAGHDDSGFHAVLDGFFFRVTSLLLEVATVEPCSLLVDDLQWADSLSLDTLTYLARRLSRNRAPPLALFFAARLDNEADRAVVDHIRSTIGSLEPQELDGLSAEDVESFLRAVLGDTEAPTGFADRLRDDTGGNPLFIVEYLELLARSGSFERRGQSWRLEPELRLRVPASLEEAAARRIESIDGLRRDLLDAAAILTIPSTREELLDFLRATAGDGSPAPKVDETRAALAQCVLGQLLCREGARYSFAHAALERAVYESIDAHIRQKSHRQAADWLLERHEGNPHRILEQLGRHLYASDTPQRARVHLHASGKRALQSGALREAETHLTRAIEVGESRSDLFATLLLREEVRSLRGDRESQNEDIVRLRELAAEIADPSTKREIVLREALYLDAIGRKREALGKIDEGLEGAEPRGPLEARLISRRGMFQLFLAEYDAARESLGEALSIAEQTGDRELEAASLQLIGTGHYLQGDYDDALRPFERALTIRRDLADHYRAGSLESNIGLIHFDRGLLTAAEERFQSSLKCFRRAGVRAGEAGNLVNLGLVHTNMGRFERALDYISQSLEIRREIGDRREIGTDLGNLAEVWMRIGLFDRTTPLLDEAIEIARRVENYLSLSINESRRGLVELLQGDAESASVRLDSARELVERVGGHSQKIAVWTTLARCRLRVEDADAALTLIDTALELARRASIRNATVELSGLRARALLDLERLAEADETSAEAVSALEEFPGWLDCSQEVWFTRYLTLDALHRRGNPDVDPDAALRRAHDWLHRKADAFEDSELRRAFLENISAHRELERLHRELETRVREETTKRERSFYEIARSLTSILELDPLLDRLLELAIATTQAEKGLILLRSRDGKLTTRAARGMPKESVEDAAEICQSVIADVTTGAEPVLATDASSDDRFRDRNSIISFRIRTLMCVPLARRDEVLGAVYVDGRGSSKFSTDDLDYLVSFAQIAAIAVDNARLMGGLRRENHDLRQEFDTRHRFENLVCRSPAMEQLAHVVDKVARTEVSVLLTGETGTGKSVIARAVHLASPRHERPFVTVDCGALPENLLESELFGHRKGAFSGAVSDRVGLIEEAQGGTLFLDEITNTTLDLQAKLLRVLQEGEIRRVGDNDVRKVDVRVLAATNTSLREAVDAGRFREDLYYRLDVLPIEVPRLRDRREDIPALAVHFLDRSSKRAGKPFAGFTEDAMRLLENARWKGNVRELENMVEKIVVLCDDDRVSGEFVRRLLPRGEEIHGEHSIAATAPAPTSAGASPRPDAADDVTLEEFDRLWLDAERRFLLELVERSSWNLSAAGRLAGVRNRNTLVSRLKKHGLSRPTARRENDSP